MNALAVINGLSKAAGGTAYCVPSLSNALARIGICRYLLNIRILKDGESNLPDPNLIHVYDITAKQIGFIRWAPSLPSFLKKVFQQEKIDLVHSHGVWQPGTHTVARVSRQLKIPRIVTTHGMLTQWHFHHKAWKKLPAWWLYQKKDLETANVVHITSQDEGKDLRKIGFKGPMALIPNGTEIPEWREPSNKGKEYRTALFISRFHLKKGLLNLVEAWSRVRPKGWRMLLVGPDTEGYKKTVQEAVKLKGLEKEFILQGPVFGEEKWNLYQNADLFILPTFSENFGIVIPEALACGLPVITTYGAPWNDLNERKCGWWIPIGVDPLVKALQDATEISKDELIEMGRSGRKLVEDKYTWVSVASKMKMLYEWVIGGGKPPEFMRLD